MGKPSFEILKKVVVSKIMEGFPGKRKGRTRTIAPL